MTSLRAKSGSVKIPNDLIKIFTRFSSLGLGRGHSIRPVRFRNSTDEVFSQKQGIFRVPSILIFAKDYLIIELLNYLIIEYTTCWYAASCEETIRLFLISQYKIELQWPGFKKWSSFLARARDLAQFLVFSASAEKGGGRLAKRGAQFNWVLIIIFIFFPCSCPEHVLSIFSSLFSS